MNSPVKQKAVDRRTSSDRTAEEEVGGKGGPRVLLAHPRLKVNRCRQARAHHGQVIALQVSSLVPVCLMRAGPLLRLFPHRAVTCHSLCNPHRLLGPVVKACTWRTVYLGTIPAFAVDAFARPSHPSDLNICTPSAPGVIGPALGLVGPLSAYCH